jgi:hypothetical protein
MEYVDGISAKFIIDNLQQVSAAVKADKQICFLSAGHCLVKLAQGKGFANIRLVYAMFERRWLA